VTLENLYVEGLVHITELGGEYFRYEEARQELRGERTGIRYALGSRLQVQVSRVDLDGRRIDFRLVTGDEPARRLPREPRERGVGKGVNLGQEQGDAAAAGAAAPAPHKAKRTRAAATPEAQYPPKRTRKAVREVPRAAGTPAASATRGAGKTKKGKR